MFTALAAPELLIPDRRDGVLSMLSSRPMTPSDYLGARFAALVAVVGAFLLGVFLGASTVGRCARESRRRATASGSASATPR